MPSKQCPSNDELKTYALGTLPESQADEVTRHLSECEGCEETVHEIATAATGGLMELIQAPKVAQPYVDESACRKVVEVVKRNLPSPDESATPNQSPAKSVPSTETKTGKHLSRAEFVDFITTFGFVSAGDVALVEKQIPADKADEVQSFAQTLVQQGKLTKFQAAAVYQGKGKSLVFGDYLVIDRLGAGGMGQVFKARHRRMDRIVALKVLSPAAMKNADSIRRFEREVRAAAKLIHPNIVHAYDAGAQDNVHYLVMEHVAGPDLSSLVRKQGKLSVKQATDFITQAARGFAFAHSKGIVHRDIKPGNLLVDQDGTVKVLDMGLARFNDTGLGDVMSEGELTRSGAVMGTVDYMAPEQALNTRHADAKSDVYGLGCTFYRILTGENVFGGDTVVEKILAHRERPVPPLRKVRPDASPALEALIGRMLSKRPDQRPTMQEIADALPVIESNPTFGVTPLPVGGAKPCAPPPLPVPPRTAAAGVPPRRNYRTPLIAAGAAGAVLICLGIWVSIRNKDGKEVGRMELPDGGSVVMDAKPEAEPPITPRSTVVPSDATTPVAPADRIVSSAGSSNATTTVRDPGAVTSIASVAPVIAAPMSSPPLPGSNMWIYPEPYDPNKPLVTVENLHYDGSHPLMIEAWVVPRPSPSLESFFALGFASLDRPAFFEFAGRKMPQARASWEITLDRSTRRFFGGYKFGPTPSDTTRKLGYGGAMVGTNSSGAVEYIAITFSAPNNGAQEVLLWFNGKMDSPKNNHVLPGLLHDPLDFFQSQGYIDELRISKTVRHRGDFTPERRFEPDADTIALYHCDEGSGDRLIDSSGNGNHGKLLNARWASTDAPVPPQTVPNPIASTLLPSTLPPSAFVGGSSPTQPLAWAIAPLSKECLKGRTYFMTVTARNVTTGAFPLEAIYPSSTMKHMAAVQTELRCVEPGPATLNSYGYLRANDTGPSTFGVWSMASPISSFLSNETMTLKIPVPIGFLPVGRYEIDVTIIPGKSLGVPQKATYSFSLVDQVTTSDALPQLVWKLGADVIAANAVKLGTGVVTSQKSYTGEPARTWMTGSDKSEPLAFEFEPLANEIERGTDPVAGVRVRNLTTRELPLSPAVAQPAVSGVAVISARLAYLEPNAPSKLTTSTRGSFPSDRIPLMQLNVTSPDRVMPINRMQSFQSTFQLADLPVGRYRLTYDFVPGAGLGRRQEASLEFHIVDEPVDTKPSVFVAWKTLNSDGTPAVPSTVVASAPQPPTTEPLEFTIEPLGKQIPRGTEASIRVKVSNRTQGSLTITDIKGTSHNVAYIQRRLECRVPGPNALVGLYPHFPITNGALDLGNFPITYSRAEFVKFASSSVPFPASTKLLPTGVYVLTVECTPTAGLGAPQVFKYEFNVVETGLDQAPATLVSSPAAGPGVVVVAPAAQASKLLPIADPERRAITWAQPLGAKLQIRLNGKGVGANPIPDEPFTVRHIDFRENLNRNEARRTLQDADIENLAGLKEITQLRLPYAQITDLGLTSIGTLATLTDLDLTETKITDAGIPKLAALKSLNSLRLNGTTITNVGLERIVAQFPMLSEPLELNDTKVTDAGMAQLPKLTYLRYLGLTGTDITDQCIPHLAAIPRLAGVQLTGTRITAAGVAQLKATAARKDLDIVWDGSKVKTGPLPPSVATPPAAASPVAVVATPTMPAVPTTVTNPAAVPTSVPATTPAAAASARLPVPDAKAQQSALLLIKDVYKDDYIAARVPDKKSEFADKLLDQSRQTVEPTDRFVLLGEARTYAVDGDDAAVLRRVLTAIVDTYDVDPAAIYIESWKAVLAKSRPTAVARAIYDENMGMLEAAVSRAAFDEAKRFGDFAASIAPRIGDATAAKTVRDRNAALATRQQEWTAATAALKKLAATPADPEANLAVGRYRALVEEDWPAAFPLLAKGSDPTWKELAAKSVAVAADGLAKAGVADAFWEASKVKGAGKSELAVAALYWYQAALPSLTGLQKVRIEKRIAEATAAVPADKLPATPLDH